MYLQASFIAILSQFSDIIATMSSNKNALIEKLKHHGYSSTKARIAVFMELQQNGPCSILELYSNLDTLLHRASIYRVIKLFEELGIVRRIQIGWKYKLELSDIFNDHHHHAHCISCQAIISLPLNNHLERLIFDDAEKQNFKVTGHNVELYGYCEQCHTKKMTPDK